MRMTVSINGLVAAALLGMAALANAAFPDKPVRLVVPFPPGGATDIVARITALETAKLLGQQIIIDNRGGAGGTIGTNVVAKSAANGYTLLMATNSHTANPAIYPELPFNTQKDFGSVAMIADSPGLLVAHPSVPVSTFKEFIDLARKSNPPLTYGTAGAGTFPHLGIELLKNRVGIDMTPIHYKGQAPAMTDLIGGAYQVKMDGLSGSDAYIKSGKLKLLAVASLERMPQLPNAATIAESGYPGFEYTFWMAILAPAGTPKDIVARLQQAFSDAVHQKEITQKLSDIGVRAIGKPTNVVDELIARELAQWPPIIKRIGITAN